MRKNGYDDAMPVIIWKEKDVLIDGHTRLRAAKAAGISSIPAVYASFENEESALDYMHRIQFNRRNITDADPIKLIINAIPQYEKGMAKAVKQNFSCGALPDCQKLKQKKL